MVFESGNDAGPWRHNLLALVVADGERDSDGSLEGYAAFHHRGIDLQQQRIDGLSAAVSPWVRKACRCVGYSSACRELQLDADLAPLVADGPSAFTLLFKRLGAESLLYENMRLGSYLGAQR